MSSTLIPANGSVDASPFVAAVARHLRGVREVQLAFGKRNEAPNARLQTPDIVSDANYGVTRAIVQFLGQIVYDDATPRFKSDSRKHRGAEALSTPQNFDSER